jgi:hypothetical protein
MDDMEKLACANYIKTIVLGNQNHELHFNQWLGTFVYIPLISYGIN